MDPARARSHARAEALRIVPREPDAKSDAVHAITPNGYHLYYSHHNDNSHSVEASTRHWGPTVGEAEFIPHPHGLKAWQVNVHPEHRRKGLASAMYNFAEQQSGKKIHQGDFETPEGAAFQKGRK